MIVASSDSRGGSDIRPENAANVSQNTKIADKSVAEEQKFSRKSGVKVKSIGHMVDDDVRAKLKGVAEDAINVKEKADGEYVYSFNAEKESSTQRTLHAAVNTRKGANGELFIDSIPQKNAFDNASGENSSKKVDDGKRSAIKYPQFTQEEIEINIEALADMESVASISEEKLQKTGKSPKTLFAEYFESLGNSIYSDIFGDIALGNSSVKSEIRHGITAEKIASMEAIPDVIEKGRVVFLNKKGDATSTVERIVVAAPIKIAEESYYMGVMLQRDSRNQRLYLHNVASIKEKEVRMTLQADSLTNWGYNEDPTLFITSILQNAINVKLKRKNLLPKVDSGKRSALKQDFFENGEEFRTPDKKVLPVHSIGKLMDGSNGAENAGNTTSKIHRIGKMVLSDDESAVTSINRGNVQDSGKMIEDGNVESGLKSSLKRSIIKKSGTDTNNENTANIHLHNSNENNTLTKGASLNEQNSQNAGILAGQILSASGESKNSQRQRSNDTESVYSRLGSNGAYRENVAGSEDHRRNLSGYLTRTDIVSPYSWNRFKESVLRGLEGKLADRDSNNRRIPEEIKERFKDTVLKTKTENFYLFSIGHLMSLKLLHTET